MSDHEWVTIEGEGVALEAVLVPKAGATAAGVICHPHPLYGGDMHNPVVRAIETGMQRVGLATLRFNFRGAGESTGVHDHGVKEQDDLRVAVDYLSERTGCRQVLVAGYSFGSVVALRALRSITMASGAIAVAPPLAMMPLADEEVDVPQLFLVGDNDSYCPRALAEDAVKRHSGLRELRIIPGADHLLMGFSAEIADAVGAFIAPFIDDTAMTHSH